MSDGQELKSAEVIAHDKCSCVPSYRYKYLVSGNDKPLRSMKAVIDAFMAHPSQGTIAEEEDGEEDGEGEEKAALVAKKWCVRQELQSYRYEMNAIAGASCRDICQGVWST